MKKVLFICLGNICRSPTAESVLKSKVREKGLDGQIYVDSAGTSAYHVGHRPDERMQSHAAQRGYLLDSYARQFNPPEDFKNFDYIITMDNSNFRNVRATDPEGHFSAKIHRMTDFCRTHDLQEVPDPYYGGAAGFELVLDIIEDGCDGLLAELEPSLD